jgi:serine protease Do
MDVNLRSISKRLSGARAFVLALALMLSAGIGFEAKNLAHAQQAQLPSPSDLSRTFINVAKQVKPAVVNIDVVEKARRSSSMRLPEGFPQIPGFPPSGEGQSRRQRGTGSGVIISADGYILTNNHVAGEAEQINVKLSDGREFKARRVGTDPETDIAVIKIDAQNLPYARLGNSDSLEQGEWVIALGSPFGLEQTMTAGIVSATGRTLTGTYDNYIQTDASINPGNSGGPLINMQGEVVGINTMIFSRSGGSEGIGFAIPANLVNKVYAQLIKGGKVTRGYLGVTLQPVTAALARTVGYDGKDGALINDLANTDAPAAKAGLRSGDIIVEVNGKAVKSPKEVTELVADLPVGKAVPVKFVRDGRVQTTTVTLAERPARLGEPAREENDDEGENPGKLGITIQNVTPEVARQLKLKITSGVLITDVQPDGPAAEAGLNQGDVIHRVGRTPINSRQDFMSALASIKNDKEIVLQVERGGQLRFVSVTLE